jgi:phosphogluconate dehydratase
LGHVRSGDIIRLDCENGLLEALVSAEEWKKRLTQKIDLSANQVGMGRELFAMFRHSVSAAEEGAATFGLPPVLPTISHDTSLSIDAGEPFNDEDTPFNDRDSAVISKSKSL